MRLPGSNRLHRRLDIRCMPEDQYHFGIAAAAFRSSLVSLVLNAFDTSKINY